LTNGEEYSAIPDNRASLIGGSSEPLGHNFKGMNLKTMVSPINHLTVDRPRGARFTATMTLMAKKIFQWQKTLKPPEGLDIDTLIKSTEDAFEVIVPWCGIQAE